MIKFYCCLTGERFWMCWPQQQEIAYLTGLDLDCDLKPCKYMTTTVADMQKHIWDVHLRQKGQPDLAWFRRHEPLSYPRLKQLISCFSQAFELTYDDQGWRVMELN